MVPVAWVVWRASEGVGGRGGGCREEGQGYRVIRQGVASP